MWVEPYQEVFAVLPELRRILVVAKPTLGRSLEAILRGADYEVHRIPDVRLLETVVTRLRPHVVISALSLASLENFAAGRLSFPKRRSIPVLLLGDADSDPEHDSPPILPLPIESARLLESICHLIEGVE
jgi:hypothetical protein